MLSTTARSFAVRQHARTFHASVLRRSEHGHYHHLPFDFPGEKKAAFGLKVFAFLVSGFSIPIFASVYQLFVTFKLVLTPKVPELCH
ncbi:hypothetical protein M378DRAFT_67661 [Amanita muscaria Koide BX008]|uniref:Cytochrome c oxidase subunit 8, mitochondrial n=1 Tax=Amanita muscaria (strain Koide BX008) TaxID=946122 RepID=A0A0C2X733_AMAMK|nr:hypothetical protein M378DRAFT_67661 [Amanita muscaria Koide BX008]